MLKPHVSVRLGGVLVVLLLLAAALGQYFLSRNDSLKSLVAYAIAIAAFSLLLYGRARLSLLNMRLLPRLQLPAASFQVEDQPGRSSHVVTEVHEHHRPIALPPLWRCSLAVVSTVALLATLIELARPYGPRPAALVLWAVALSSALASALPEAALHRHWIERLMRLARSREGAAVLVVLAIGAVLRLYDLAHFPSGVHGDEASFALIAANLLKGQLIDPFGPIFLADNALFAYLDAPFLAIFGQTITGMRVFGALAGALTLPAFYLLMQRMFGTRPAVLALLLLAGNAAAVHFSRLALNVPQVSLFMCLSFWALWEGKVHDRAFWWLASGVFGALPVYFHFSGLLFPPLLTLLFAYLVLTQRNQRLTWLRGAVLGVLGGVLGAAPFMMEILRGQRGAESHVGGRLIFDNWSRVAAAQHTTSPPLVVLGQIRTNLLGFFSLGDVSDFYTFAHAPLIAPLLGPLIALGLLLMLARFYDPRYGLLSLWFWVVVIVGGALSIDSPAAHRLLPAVLPALAGVALVLDWLAEVGPRLVGQWFQPAFVLVLTIIPLLAGLLDLSNYFGPAAASKPFEQATAQAQYLASLGSSYEIRVLGAPQMYFSSPDTKFLAPNAKGTDLTNPTQDVPVAIAPQHDLAFIVYGWMAGYLPMLQSAYPGGQLVSVPGHAGPVFDTYLVPRQEVARWQGLTADYGGFQRMETDTSSLGGGASSYPITATWSGAMYIHQPDNYGFGCRKSCQVLIDSQSVTTPGLVYLASGWHAVKLTGQLADSDERLSLTQQRAGGNSGPIPSYELDARSVAGQLQATIIPDGGSAMTRVDRALGSRDMWRLLGVGKPATATWRGTLLITPAGQYGFALEADADATFTIDGDQVLNTGGGVANGARPVSAGTHRFAVTYRSIRNPGMLELRWTPPGGRQAIIPPDAFSAPAGAPAS